ncbi:MAG: fermentation-respiration switch protein FrsA (DUF1100 family) [Candidatus Woesearchaeota archaeon]|jgi:fermentation-respiration switch protein FrsA (DUF1100 family)
MIKKLPWSHVVDKLPYDLLPRADKLTMPVLIIVGEEDTSCPVADQEALYDVLPESKKLLVLEGLPHTYKKKEDIAKVKKVIFDWLGEVN